MILLLKLIVVRKVIPKGRGYDKIRCWFIKNKKQIYGPQFPTLGGCEDMSMSSLHAEEGLCKKLLSQNISLKNGTLYVIRWTYDKQTDVYSLCNCVPCKDCVNYLTKKNIKNIVISTDNSEEPLKKVDLDYLKLHTRPSKGRLHGR